MGLVAVAGGFAYKIIHILWLKKFDAVRKAWNSHGYLFNNHFYQAEESDLAENGENEKLSPEPKTRDASTGMSHERLSLMIKYNQVGSLTSLSRGSKVRETFC